MAGKSRKEKNEEQPVIQNIINLNTTAKKSPGVKRKPTEKVTSNKLERETDRRNYLIVFLLILIIVITLYLLMNPDMLPGIRQGEGVRTISY